MNLKACLQKIKTFWRYLAVPGFLLFSGNAFAEVTFRNLFAIPQDDTSIKLLQNIFGNVGNVLTAVTPTGRELIFQVMFRHFNQAVLGLVIIVILYTMLAGILATAHEGQFLGKAFHSMWVPVRTVAGFALLIPTKTGYSIIQIFFMWVVLQGIGAADQLWNEVVGYLQTGGSVVAPVGAAGAMAGKLSNSEIGKTFTEALLCMHTHAKSREEGGMSVFPNSYVRNNVRGYEFPNKDTGDSSGCGVVTWDMPKETKGSDPLQNAKLAGLDDGVQVALPALSEAMWVYVQTPGTEDVKKKAASPKGKNPLAIFQAAVNGSIGRKVQKVVEEQVKKSEQQGGGDFWTESKKYGWANAGAYFYTIAHINNSNDAALLLQSSDVRSSVPVFNKGTPENRFVDSLMTQGVLGGLSPSGKLPDIGGSKAGRGYGIASIVVSGLLYVPFSLFVKLITWSMDLTPEEDKFWGNPSIHPIIKLQNLGSKLVGACTMMYGIMITLGMIAAAVAYICTSTQPAFGITQFINTFVLIPLMALVGILMGAGLSFAIYLPMVPYIIFTFMVIGWMIAVMETMIAAPLVAMGLSFPEGDHMIFGRAQKSMQMIMNVFARPMLMIFGLIAAIILSFVAINFASEMFGRVLINIAGSDFMTQFNPFYQVSYIIIYFGLVITIINRCFSLIHLFPDKILSWIGWQSQFGAYKMGEDKVEAQFEKGAKGAVGGAAGMEKAGGWQTGRKWQKGLGDEEGMAQDAMLRKKGFIGKVSGGGFMGKVGGFLGIGGDDKNIVADAEAKEHEMDQKRKLRFDKGRQKDIDKEDAEKAKK